MLVYEYCCGGGLAQPEANLPMVRMGWAMLRAVLQDLKKWGRVRTVSLLHNNLRHLAAPADRVVGTTHAESRLLLDSLLDEADAALIIAPEEAGGLAGLSAMALEHGAKLLGSSPQGIIEAGDKWRCYKRLAHAGISTPTTQRLQVDMAKRTAKDFSYPIVIKPRQGAGCQGVHCLQSPAELRSALESQCADSDFILVQPYLRGNHLSVSCLVSADEIWPLCLNRQDILMGNPCRYLGCEITNDAGLRPRAFALAEQALAQFEGLRGFVGVDLVFSDGQLYVIEINPRITMAYVSLRQAIKANLAQMIWRSIHCEPFRQSVSPTRSDGLEERLLIGH